MNFSAATLEKYLPYLIFVMFPAISYLISRFGGWSSLAAAYRRPEGKDPINGSWKLTSAQIGGVSYSNCIFLRTDDDGLYVSVLFLFRPGHPPLFIPWRDIEAEEKKFIFGFKTLSMRFAMVRDVEFKLPEKFAKNEKIASRIIKNRLP